MAKEMIVSVNGREKKIAILEDGKVTEFYIERGEENSGVVGNIYKGRVMRVLPGMQSAFVDIGLERDAFLYVSDFFDEEEEFERIVVEKAKKTDVASAEKAASEKLQQARLEREQAMEALQERAEPLSVNDTKSLPVKSKSAAPIKNDEPDEDEEFTAPIENDEPDEDDDVPSAKVRARPLIKDAASNKRDDDNNSARTNETFVKETAPALTPLREIEDAPPPVDYQLEDSNFERVVDDETEGDLFKEARVQERLTDQVRAIEFEIEPTANVEVGTLVLDRAANQFERVDDGEGEEVQPQTTADATQTATASEESTPRRRRNRRGKGGGKSAETAEQSTADAADDKTVEQTEAESNETDAATTTADDTEPTSSGRRKRGGRRKNAVEATESSESSDADDANSTGDVAENTVAENAENDSTSRETGENQAVESDSSAANHNESMESVESVESVESANTEVAAQNESGDSSPSETVASEELSDASASVDDLGEFREEMAVRRGGRRRRGGRTGNRPNETGEAGDANENGEATDDSDEDDAEDETLETVEAAPEVSARVETARSETSRGRVEQRPERAERTERGGERSPRNDRAAVERPERSDRPERTERSDRTERNDRNDRDRRDRRPPTITDLLREGQEVLVQIAKEPIAKKGARITSHIALPGRYIVYMPTIEHVGVSRKIESSQERIRLRNMIQKIRNEEDVPSGGFIVRTAGVGITEQNLRDDARYLVRTWLDIRKSAEKTKSPALAHQDLDLVQRILRDQLSEEFAAIRVDDEAEYLRTVEFINRIQPKMVNRVKLYTRDEPIMQQYGVQEEIDKAVKPRVWLKSGGYLVINQTEALVSIDVNTGKFVGGRGGGSRLEDTITKTNMEAVDEIARQIRLRDLGGIIVLDLIDMEDRRNRQKVLQALQDALQSDKSPTKVLSFNDFGLITMTRKRVKQSLERTLCSPCHYCQGAGLIKSPQTVAYEILAEARTLSKGFDGDINQTTLRVHPEIAKALRTTERDVLTEIEDYLGVVDVTADVAVHQEQFDFAFV